MLFSLSPLTFDLTTIDWKVIIGVIAVILTGFGLLYFQWWRNRKRLSYEVLSNVILISTEEEIRDKVEIHFEGQPVKNVRLIVVKLINDGYVPIKKDDFEKGVRFVFPGARILTSEKVKFHPDNMRTIVSYRDDWTEIAPTLFNRKDYVQFKALISDYSGMKVDARIVGVSAIEKTRILPKSFEYVWSSIIAALLIIALEALAAAFALSTSVVVLILLMAMALFIVTAVLFSKVFAVPKKRK
jgi:hypothetical protein